MRAARPFLPQALLCLFWLASLSGAVAKYIVVQLTPESPESVTVEWAQVPNTAPGLRWVRVEVDASKIDHSGVMLQMEKRRTHESYFYTSLAGVARKAPDSGATIMSYAFAVRVDDIDDVYLSIWCPTGMYVVRPGEWLFRPKAKTK